MYLKFRHIVVYLTLLILFVGCKKTFNSQTLIEEHFKLLNQHNAKELVKQYNAKCFMNPVSAHGMANTHRWVLKAFTDLFQLSPDVKYEIISIAKNDSTVFVEYNISSTHDYKNFKNVFYRYRNCSVFKIKNERISEEITFSDKDVYALFEND